MPIVAFTCCGVTSAVPARGYATPIITPLGAGVTGAEPDQCLRSGPLYCNTTMNLIGIVDPLWKTYGFVTDPSAPLPPPPPRWTTNQSTKFPTRTSIRYRCPVVPFLPVFHELSHALFFGFGAVGCGLASGHTARLARTAV